MVRTKLVAILLGPSGVGLVGLYASVTGLVGTISGLGIASSGVREVAEAHGSGDVARLSVTAKTLRRASWGTGILGWILSVAFAFPLSQWAFGSGERAGAIALLGASLLVAAVSAGQSALIQGTRRISDLARLSILGTVAGTVISLGLYAWLRERAIVPVVIATAIANLGFSWWFARKISLDDVPLTVHETWRQSRRLLTQGLAFMWSAVAAAGVALITRSLIVRELGLESNGIHQAAWGISGMFAGFILGAMGSDFFPRLTAVSDDHEQVNRLVNEQTEIGILLALPGLMGTLAFGPWIMNVFYSAKFLPGADLLPWFVLGVFGKVVSWPMGFTMIAKGAKGWFAISETGAATCQLILTVGLLYGFGLVGTAVAYAVLYLFYTGFVFWICRRLTSFGWSPTTLRLLGASTVMVLAAFGCSHLMSEVPGLICGGVLTLIATVYSLRGFAHRLGSEHRIVKICCRIPVIGLICRN